MFSINQSILGFRLRPYHYVAVAWCVFVATPLEAFAAPWPPAIYNPKPLEHDVLLPMPCDGSMVFRVIEVAAQTPLDDARIGAGSPEATWGVLEGRYDMHIAGSFSPVAPKRNRFYLLAKYEVSKLQYAAVMQEQCLQPSTASRLPQTSVSWFDAVEFANRYSQWLQTHAVQSLPTEDGVAGFVRLPTEAEWTYATRGGLAVALNEFEQSRFPMTGPLAQYVWYAGPSSSNGSIRPTGLLQPNPLGLHDVLGNADEMMFEPFRLRTHGREHGQAGGFIVRGGNYLTPGDDIRTSWRVEQPYYQQGQPTRLKTTGFRLSLVAPTTTSSQRLTQLQQDWLALGQSSSADEANATDTLGRLAEQTDDDAVQNELNAVRDRLRSANQVAQEQRERAMRSSLQLGAFLCTQLNQMGRHVERGRAFIAHSCKAENPLSTEQTCQQMSASLAQSEKALDVVLGLYSDSIVELGSIYAQTALEAQKAMVRELLIARRQSNLDRYVDTYVLELRDYADTRMVDKARWLDNCVKVVP
jgi:hypothetical protein